MADSGTDSNTVPTGCFCQEISEGIHPTGTKSQLSSEKRVDGTLRESSTNDIENENIYKSPVTIERLICMGNGVCLVKISGGKTYALPFAFANKPQIIYSEGFYCIMHETVWYKLEQSCLDYLYLQNTQTKKYIKMYEYSESIHGTREKNKKRTNSKHASHNECQESLDSQTIADSCSVAMEGITNSSVVTAQRAEGGIVTKTDKMAGERTEINRGETYERDNEEKPVDETEDKSRTASIIPSGGNTVRGFEAEIDTNMDQTQNGDHVQRFKGEFRSGETNKISGDTDKTKEEDKSQAIKEEVIQSKGRSTSFRLLGKTEKTPKKETFVEDFCEIEGIETDENLGGTGSTSEGNVNNISSSSAVATEIISDPAMMGRKRGSQESDKNEPFPDLQEEVAPKPLPRRKRTHSSKSVEEKINPLDWRCNEGNAQVIKLLISYQKKQGEKNENDVSKHRVSCNLNFHLIWNFYTQTDCGRKMLDAKAAKHDCKVSLPTDQLKEFFIFQVSNVEFEEELDAKNYVDDVIDSVYISAQESLSIDSIRVDPGLQDDIREKLKERKQLNGAWIEFINEGTQVTVYTVCDKEHQQSVVQIITELAEDAAKSFDSHIEMVTADFMWQRVMTRFEYLKEIESKFPNTVIIQDENANAFQLKGRRDEVRVVAGYLEKLLKTAQNEFHVKVFSSGYQFEIFTYPEMCSYINGFLPNLPLVWIPNHLTKKIHLFSRDQKHLKGIDKLIEGCVKERFYPLSEGYSKLPSEKIHSLEELNKTYKGQIVIHPSDSPTGLLVTVVDEIFQSVDVKMRKIISSEMGEVHPETPLPEKCGKGGHPGYNPELSATNPEIKMSSFSLEKVQVSDKNVAKVFEVKDKILFRKLCMEDMADMSQEAKEHCVSLHQLESQSGRVGFELKGPEKEVHHIYEYITERIQAEEQQMQLQNDNSGMAAGIKKAEQAPSPGTAEMSEDSKVSGSFFKRIQVIVQKGQLHEAQAEVLVNTVARSLDLTKGKISSSLLSIAGDGIQKELYEYKKEKISIGQVLKTGVGILTKPRRAIFHGALYSYEEHPDSYKVFKNFLCDCLEHANKKYKSIAFPPIGTGGLGYPKDLVASLMFQSVAEFEKAHTKSKLEVVMFVIYENDQETLKEFEEMYKRCVGKMTSPFPTKTTEVDELKAVPAVIGVSKVLKYGQVQVQAKLGTFENESQNCLLVLWEKQCLYNISDKNRILQSAGSKVTQKWKNHRNAGHFHRDVVLVTPGGNLRYTEIIHVASVINQISNVAKAGLMKADIEKMKTVVIPINNDDSLPRDANKFCMEILKAVNELAANLKFVKSVTLVIQGQLYFQFFNEVFEQESRICGAEKKTDETAVARTRDYLESDKDESSPGLKDPVTSEKVPAPCTETARTYPQTIGDASYTSMKTSYTMQKRLQQFKTMAGKEAKKVPDEDTDVPGSCPSATNLSEVDQDDSIVYIECKIEVAEDVLNSIKITYGQQGIDSLISDLDQLAKVDTHEGSILVLCDYKYAENVQKCVRNHYNKAKEKRKIKIKEENKHLIHGGNENLEWLQFAYGHTSWSKNLQLEGGKLYLTGTLQMKREVEKAVHSMNYWYQEKFTLSSEEQQKADEIVTLVKGELPTIFIKQTKETMRVLSDNRDNFERANFKVKEALGRIRITARGRRYRDLLPYDESYSGLSKDDKMDAKHY